MTATDIALSHRDTQVTAATIIEAAEARGAETGRAGPGRDAAAEPPAIRGAETGRAGPGRDAAAEAPAIRGAETGRAGPDRDAAAEPPAIRGAETGRAAPGMDIATTAKPLRYLDPASTLTLAEGLAEFRAAMDGLIAEDGLDAKALELFHNHDVAHVIFGCDTSVLQEAMIDVWTLMGTTVNARAYLDYLKLDEAKQLLREIGVWRTAWISLWGLPTLARVAARARGMRKKWPWDRHDEYLDRPLCEIRAEHGIRVFRPASV